MAVEGRSIRAISRGPSPDGRGRPALKTTATAILAPDQSAALRDRILAEVQDLRSGDEAADWARNSDCRQEQSHRRGCRAGRSRVRAAARRTGRRARWGDLAGRDRASDCAASRGNRAARSRQWRSRSVDTSTEPQIDVAATQAIPPSDVPERSNEDLPASIDPPAGIDKSVLTIAEPRRYRSKEHLRFVATRACLICGRKPSDPHHLRFTQPRALGRKVSDEFAVPLCRVHHRALHRSGNERVWWQTAGIDPIKVARKLWKKTRLDDGQDRRRAGQAAEQSPPHRRRSGRRSSAALKCCPAIIWCARAPGLIRG